MIRIRQMTSADIPDGLRLCRAAGWNQLESDWELFLQAAPQYAFVGLDDLGRVAGTTTAITYDNHFAWIGMVLVDPSRRREGIGSALMHHCVDSLANVPCIKLDATPLGREVYIKMGFEEEYLLSRMVLGTAPFSAPPSQNVRIMTDEDIQQVLSLDREIFGASRESILQWYRKQFPGLAMVVHDRDRLTGYCFGRQGHHHRSIGPIAAVTIVEAQQLLLASVQAGAAPVIVDIRQQAGLWKEWLHSLGFTEQRQLIRMYRGENLWPGEPDRQFAILGPEFG